MNLYISTAVFLSSCLHTSVILVNNITVVCPNTCNNLMSRILFQYDQAYGVHLAALILKDTFFQFLLAVASLAYPN